MIHDHLWVVITTPDRVLCRECFLLAFSMVHGREVQARDLQRPLVQSPPSRSVCVFKVAGAARLVRVPSRLREGKRGPGLEFDWALWRKRDRQGIPSAESESEPGALNESL